MKKFTALFFLYTLSSLSSQAQITFQKVITSVNNISSRSIKLTTDGGYIIAGAQGTDVALIKTDVYGIAVVSKTFHASNYNYGVSVVQTSDGGFAVAGGITTATTGDDVYLVKTDSIGNLIWSKTYGGSLSDGGYSVRQTSDGGYIIAGNTRSFGAGNSDIYLIKVSNTGNILWTKTYGTIEEDFAYCVQQTSDGGYILVGERQANTATYSDVLLIKADHNGNLTWAKTYGGLNHDQGLFVWQTDDDGYIITGVTRSFGVSKYDVYLIKTDTGGGLTWSKTFGGLYSDLGMYVQPTTDGGYFIAGTTYSFGLGDPDVYIIKTDSIGNMIWSKNLGGTDGESGYSAEQTTDGGYIISGFVLRASGETDILLIKTDSTGNTSCDVNIPPTSVTSPPTVESNQVLSVSTGGIEGNPNSLVGLAGTDSTLCTSLSTNKIKGRENNVSIYPNPFSTSTTIRIYDIRFTVYDFVLYNILGKEVLVSELRTPDSRLERSDLQSGIYFYKVTGDEGQGAREIIGAGKIIVE